jgi:hypothetical protein
VITGRLARTFDLQLVAAADRRIDRDRVANPDAQALILRGRACFIRPSSLQTREEAQRAFEQALTIDPQSIDAKVYLRATPERRREFAPDSPLEEAVLSELVSEAKFPASWENTGNFVRLGLRVRLLARNPGPNSMAYDPIPYASEQGIYFGLAGN